MRYTFREVAYGDKCEVGYAQAVCLTRSMDANHENLNPPDPSNFGMEIQIQEGNYSNAGVKQIQQGNCSSAGVERDCGGAEEAVREMHSPPTTYVPDLNEDDEPVPDLNEDGGPVPDLNEVDEPVPYLNKGGGPIPDPNENYERAEVLLTADASPALVSGGFERKFGERVKMIGRLERNGHLEAKFGMKFLTWFTQRSTSEQKRTVSLFIEVLGVDKERLAKQLVDTYSHKISNKRPKQ